MRSLRHIFASFFLTKTRMPKMEQVESDPVGCQEQMFRHLIRKARNTEWGRLHDYAHIKDYETFRQNVPVNTYETFFPFHRAGARGDKYVLWPGKVTWFAKSSGTTNDRSKFIPMTKEILEDNHFAVAKTCLRSISSMREKESNAFRRQDSEHWRQPPDQSVQSERPRGRSQCGA